MGAGGDARALSASSLRQSALSRRHRVLQVVSFRAVVWAFFPHLQCHLDEGVDLVFGQSRAADSLNAGWEGVRGRNGVGDSRSDSARQKQTGGDVRSSEC